MVTFSSGEICGGLLRASLPGLSWEGAPGGAARKTAPAPGAIVRSAMTFEDVVREHQDAVYGAALRILGDRDAAIERLWQRIRLEHGLFNAVAILTAALLNIVGSLVLIGGALWSGYGAWRRGGSGSRLLANVLIAGGAFIVAGASTLTRFHIYELFYVGQAVGVLVMFGGFLTAQRSPQRATGFKAVPSR